MTRDEEPEPVARAERPGGARGAGRLRERGELAVGHDLAARNRPQGVRAPLEKRRLVLEVDLDVVEADLVAREVRAEPLDELQVTVCYLHSLRREGEVVPDHAGALEPELPHAPVLDV